MSELKLTKPTVPFSEASWIQGLPSSIFTSPSHIQLREWCREWCDEVLIKDGAKYEEAGVLFDDVPYKRAAKDGVLFAYAVGVHVDPKIAKLAESVGVSCLQVSKQKNGTTSTTISFGTNSTVPPARAHRIDRGSLLRYWSYLALCQR